MKSARARAWRRRPAGGGRPLALRHLRKAYRARRIIEDVSMIVRRGEAVGLLGPNGAGKTTLFYMITGLMRPDDGRDRTRRPRRDAPADVSTGSPGDRLSASGSLDLQRPQRRRQYPGRPRDHPTRPAQARASSSRRCSRSSTSRPCANRRRSRFRAASVAAAKSRARWRAALPSCSSTSLSPASIRLRSPISRSLVQHLKQRGIGVLITDHNVRETLGLIDRAYIIHAGRVLTEGSPERNRRPSRTCGASIWAMISSFERDAPMRSGFIASLRRENSNKLNPGRAFAQLVL